MHGYWSLVIFTLLGQAAAGMLILSFFSRTADTSRAKAWAACILLGVGALASLLLIRNGVNEMLPGACRTCPCPLWIRAGIILLLIVAGEVCGRALFYSGYTWFGM